MDVRVVATLPTDWLRTRRIASFGLGPTAGPAGGLVPVLPSSDAIRYCMPQPAARPPSLQRPFSQLRIEMPCLAVIFQTTVIIHRLPRIPPSSGEIFYFDFQLTGSFISIRFLFFLAFYQLTAEQIWNDIPWILVAIIHCAFLFLQRGFFSF